MKKMLTPIIIVAVVLLIAGICYKNKDMILARIREVTGSGMTA